MRYNRIATKNHLHIVTTNEIGHVTTSTGMDHSGTKHKENFPVTGTSLFHLPGNFMNSQDFDFFRGDATLHEGEGFALTRTLKGMNTNAIMPDNHLIAYLYLVHGPTVSTPYHLVNYYSHVHFDTFNLYPLTVQAYLGRQIGGGIEVGGKDTALLNCLCLSIRTMDKDGPKLLKFGDDQFQYRIAGSLNLQTRIARLGLTFPDPHLFNVKVATTIHNNIPGTWQRPRVNDMSTQFNQFTWHRCSPPNIGHTKIVLCHKGMLNHNAMQEIILVYSHCKLGVKGIR